MAKKQQTFYPSNETADQIAELARLWGMPEERFNTPVIAKAIEAAYREEMNKQAVCPDCGRKMQYHSMPQWFCSCD